MTASAAQAEASEPLPFFQSDEYPFYSIIYPHAAYREGKTYVAFQHTKMDPHVMVFDHHQDTWSPAVRVAENPIRDNDTHGNPALWLDDEGRIHLIYGCHGGPGLHVRSREPANVDAWERLSDAAPKCTYPQISRFSNGDLLLFFRTGNHSIPSQTHAPWGYKISTDGGNTWGEFHQVTNGQGDLYASSAVGPGDSIHVGLVWESPPKIGRQDVYYLQLNGNGKALNAGGQQVPLPVGLDQLNAGNCKIYDTGEDQSTYTPTMSFAADGSAMWMGFPAVGTHEFIAGLRRTDGAFELAPVADGCNNWASDVLVSAEDSRRADVYVTAHGRPNNAGAMGGKLLKFSTQDAGRTWHLTREIAADGIAYGAVTRVHDAHPDGQILFCNRNDNTLYLWGDNGFVGPRGLHP